MSSIAMLLKNTRRSGFMRSMATLMGGNAVATAVPILAAPVLGRLYEPADYGALAQYMAPAAILRNV
jgi:O-antigen/teichoic acid export membrane protein